MFLPRGNLSTSLLAVSLLLLYHYNPHGGGGVVASSSSRSRDRGMQQLQQQLRGGSSSGGGSVKIRTTNSYRMFQLRATSMIRNRRAIHNSGNNSTYPSNNNTEQQEPMEGVHLVVVDDDNTNNSTTNATLAQHSTSTIIATDDVDATAQHRPSELILTTSCPPHYDPNRVDYFAGATVEVYETIFTCQSGPYEIYCNIDTWEEAKLTMEKNASSSSGGGGGGGVSGGSSNQDVKMLWLQAWKEVGPCSPSTATVSNSSVTSISIPGTTSTSSKPTIRIPSRRPSFQPTTVNNTTSSTITFDNTPSTSLKPSIIRIPTFYPTYHPTYSPTTDWPTYVPTTLPSGSPTSSPSWMPSSSMTPTNFPTFAPTHSPLATSPTAYMMDNDDNDESLICKSTQIHLRLEISTDNYPQDTAWQFIDRTANVILLSSPIDGYVGNEIGNGMMEVQTDTRDICLNGTMTNTAVSPRGTTRQNKYEFVIKDKYGDGLCCRPDIEEGYYKLMQMMKDIIDKRWKWSVVVAGSNFRSKEVHHHFDLLFHDEGTIESDIVQASLDHDVEKENITKPIIAATPSFELICPSPQRKITIQIQTDAFGADTSWDFRMKNGPIIAKNEARYHENHIEVDERDICINDSSLYELTVYDDFGDGMCCAYKRGGHYKIITHHPMSPTGSQTETILYGGFFRSNQVTHLINTTLPTLSDRSMNWLNSHNKRRLYWHHYYNTSYVPLQWSDALEADAKVWADTLLDSCKEGMYHDPQKTYGENAAANSGSGTWGTLREADRIVSRFIDREVDDPWPANGHLTQALWRASSYVGCADSHRFLGGRKHCHTQVCRYARVGNCDMGSHLKEDGTIDWKTPMLEDVNYCGPICPADGCKA